MLQSQMVVPHVIAFSSMMWCNDLTQLIRPVSIWYYDTAPFALMGHSGASAGQDATLSGKMSWELFPEDKFAGLSIISRVIVNLVALKASLRSIFTF